MRKNFYGTIELNKTVDITDPCYDEDVWCRTNDFPVDPGTYECYAWIKTDRETHGFGKRVAKIALNKPGKVAIRYEEKAIIGVDSGMAGFFTCDNKKYFEDVILHTDVTCSDVFIDDGVFCSSSGFGDGGYGVYAGYDKNGELVELQIRFID